MAKPSKKEIERIKEQYPFVLRASVAPELDGAMEFGRKGSELGVVISVGHTDADFDTVVKASENGYTLMTHFYSGMKGVERVNSYRVAGAVEAGYYLDDMDVEIIADGKHLPYSLLKLIYKIKGADKIALITDATRGCGFPNGTKTFIGPKQDAMEIIIDDDVAKLGQGSFAGSTATYDRLYRTMADAVGKDFVALSKMASTTPARIMGFKDRGEIAVGKRADLILMSENLEIEKIIYKGNIVK
jgi:N-acetylglucosamine-6-phosphate deacetylase